MPWLKPVPRALTAASLAAKGLSGQGSQLRRGKNFFQKAASEFVVHLGKARHFGNVDAQSDDHDSTPGSLLTRRLPAEKN